MKQAVLAVLATAAALSAPVAVATERMNDVEYLRAVRCLAFVAAAEGHVIDADALAAEVREQGHSRERYIRERARREGRTILREANRIDSDPERDAFNDDLRRACDGFEPMIAGLDPRA